MRYLKNFIAGTKYSGLKIKCIIFLPLLILFILYTTNSYGQETLTLKKAWTITIQNNYTLQQQEKLIQKADLETSIQKTGYYPTLSTSGLYARAEFNEFPIEIPNASKSVGLDLFSLSIKQPIFTGLCTHNLIKAAKEHQTAYTIQKEIVQDQLLLQIGRLYYEIQLNLLQQEVLQASIDRLFTQVQKLHNLLQMEQATPFDTLEVSNRKLQISNQLAILKDRYGILLSKLKYLLNQEQLPAISVIDKANPDLIIDDLITYQNLSLENRPELQNIAALKRAQNFQANILRSKYYPQISASLGYNYLKLKGDLFRDEWSNFYSLMLNFQWELWSWHRDKRKVQQSKIELDCLDLQSQQLIQDIRQQVQEAYLNLQTVRKQIQLQDKLVDQEKERYQLTQQRYEQGLVTSLDLRSAEHALTEAELELQKNYIAWYQQRLNLDWAIGIIGE